MRRVSRSRHKLDCERTAIFFGNNRLACFNASYRPMTLEMQVMSVSEKCLFAFESIMDDVRYDKVSANPQLCM